VGEHRPGLNNQPWEVDPLLTNGTGERALVGEIATTTPAELAGASWLAGYANELTRRSYAAHLRDWFTFCAERDVDPLLAKRVHVDLWVRSLEQRGLKPRSRALKISCVRSFYGYCVDENWLDDNPARRVQRPPLERKSPRGALSRTQLADLVERAVEMGPNQGALVMLLGFNGLRIGETCAANVQDVEYVGFSPVLRLPMRKGGKEGAAALSRPLEAILDECIDGRSEGPLLRNQAGNRMTRSNAQRILDRASVGLRGRVPRLSPHVLRHTWCTLAIDAGASLMKVQHDGGWADTRMAEYYCHTRHDPINSTTHLVAGFVLSAN
jgi:integrase/recombinase XerD